MKKITIDKTPCAICGGRKGFVKIFPEYLAHRECYQRVPVDYVLWFREAQRIRK